MRLFPLAALVTSKNYSMSTSLNFLICQLAFTSLSQPLNPPLWDDERKKKVTLGKEGYIRKKKKYISTYMCVYLSIYLPTYLYSCHRPSKTASLYNYRT